MEFIVLMETNELYKSARVFGDPVSHTDGDGLVLDVWADFFAMDPKVLEDGVDPNEPESNPYLMKGVDMEIGRKYLLGVENYVAEDEFPNSFIVRIS